MRRFHFFFFSSRRRHTILTCDWSSDVCSSDWDGAIAGQIGVGAGKTEMDFARSAAPSQIGENLRQLRGRVLTPPGLGQAVDRDIEGFVAVLHAVLDRALPAVEGAEQRFTLGAVIGKAVLHL